VIGSGLYVAEQMLHDRGLTVGSVSTQYSGATPGAVVRSNPPAFTSLPVGSAVNLVVAMPQ
jgi:beta-lactam-binding protein with PASTA domain